MRRKDREVADLEGQLAILEQCPVCRVAINDPASGVPYLIPLNFWYGRWAAKPDAVFPLCPPLAPSWTCCALTPM